MHTDDAYHIHARLGSGSTGVVFRGTRKMDGHQCALKALHPDFVSAVDVGHLRSVNAALQGVRHHALSAELQLQEVRGELVVVRPFIRGVDLGTIIAGSSAPLKPAVQIVSEVAAALDAVQRQTGVSHGDLKPSNVFLDGSADVVVVDFGMARPLPGMGERTLTLLHGSVGFMAPERADNQVSDAMDTYSLALLLCWLLTGETPPRTSANPKRQAEQRTELLQALADLDAPESLIELIGECLAYTPGDRPRPDRVARTLAVLAERTPGPGVKTWAGPLVTAIVAQSSEVAVIDDGKPLSTAGPAPQRTVSLVPTGPAVSEPTEGQRSALIVAGVALIVALLMLAAAFSLGG